MPYIDSFAHMPGAQPAAPTSDPVEQAAHAAAPTAFGFSQNAMTITLALAGIYGFIYLLHVLERMVRA